MIDELFRCQEGLHDLNPGDPLDPAGTACQCGAITLIGVMAAVQGERKVFLRYLIDTNQGDDEDEVDTDTIARLKRESIYEDD